MMMLHVGRRIALRSNNKRCYYQSSRSGSGILFSPPKLSSLSSTTTTKTTRTTMFMMQRRTLLLPHNNSVPRMIMTMQQQQLRSLVTKRSGESIRFRLWQQQKKKSGNKKSGSGNDDTKKSSSWFSYFPSLRLIARVMRLIRIPTLVIAVYGLGYQKGIVDTIRSPAETSAQIMQNILSGFFENNGDKDKDSNSAGKVNVFTNASAHYQDSNLIQTIARVGDDITYAATLYVQEQLEQAIAKEQAIENNKGKWKNNSGDHNTDNDDSNDERSVDFWKDALHRLQGESIGNQLIMRISNKTKNQITPTTSSISRNTAFMEDDSSSNDRVTWQYVFIASDTPNAFVTELLPQVFFITSGLFDLDLINNEDELAMVLGHEISHLILGHITEKNQLELGLRTVELLLLSLDITDGLLDIVFMNVLNWIRKLITASQSRESEHEADALGIIIAAKACYDTQNGCTVMKNFHNYDMKRMSRNSNNTTTTTTDSSQDSKSSSEQLLHLMDSHPPSIERYDQLVQLSQIENPNKYIHTTCTPVRTRLDSIKKLFTNAQNPPRIKSSSSNPQLAMKP